MTKLAPIAPATITLAAPTEARVLAACREAENALQGASLKCLIAGQLLLEHREALSSSHDGKNLAWQGKKKAESDKFSTWIEKHGLSKSTAYRWMEVAERVGRLQLDVPMAYDFKPVIEVGGESVALSLCLTAPEKELTGKALKFRQDVFDFMADKTLSEALNACVDGESDPKRITLAGKGKKTGGSRGEDRKAFEKFTSTKLKHLTTFFGKKLHVNQRALIIAAFNSALELWPRWLLEALADKCKSELKLSDHDRAHRETI